MSVSHYRDVYSGVLHKCGGRIKSWTKRWMVLRSDYCLYYYKDATKNHLGVISLRDTNFKIRVGQRSDVSWPKNLALENTFALVTTPRVYFMYAETRAEAEEWRKVLEDAHHDLVEVTRTKSFSGCGLRTTTEQNVDLSSFSAEVNNQSLTVNGARPKALASVSDSITSNTSSVFGRQYVLSSSSELDSSMPPKEIDSIYNVLQHPLTEERSAKQTANVSEDRNMGESGGGYSKLPLDKGGKCDENTTADDILSNGDEECRDYVLPPDAVESCPQNISVIVEKSEQPDYKWAEPDVSGAGSTDKRPLSQNSLEAFYDFAREVSDSGQREIDGAVYEEVHAGGNIPADNFEANPNPQKTSALTQPLPALPPTFSDHEYSKSLKERPSLIYEDIPDLSGPQAVQQEVFYETVGVPENDEAYSQVEYVEEGGDSQGGGSTNFLETNAPPLPLRHHPPSPLPPQSSTHLPPSPPPPKPDGDVCITKPVPRPRTKSSTPSPSNRCESDQLPSNRHESAQLPSSEYESDGIPSNRESGSHSPAALSPRMSPVPPTKYSPPPSDGIAIPAKQRTYESSSSPPSPSSIQPFQRKFSPPPSPRSRTSPRPPSPLLSDRRVSGSDLSQRSSAPSSPGNEGTLDTVQRQRMPSTKEKGMALFQRRQQEVATLSEEDTQRRKRSMSMLKGVQDDEGLCPDDKVLFAETLREVESERMKASEERFRWERERMQLEEERRQLEIDKLRLREELERTRNEILQS